MDQYHNTTPSSSGRKSLNTERLMGYYAATSESSDAPLAMPISDYSGRSSRTSLTHSRSPLPRTSRKTAHKDNNNNNSGHSRRSGLRSGLKALLSPLTPGRKKRSVLDTRSTRGTRKTLSPKLFGSNSPKTAGGRKKFVMNRLALRNLDDDEDEADSINSTSPLPIAPKRKLSKNSLINKLSITNLDDDEDDDIVDENDRSTRSTSIRRGGRRPPPKKSLLLSDVFGSKNNLLDDEDDGPCALNEWRQQRKMAMSDDHVTCRDFQGNDILPSSNRSSSAGGIRSIFSKSDKEVRYSIRKSDSKKPDGSLDLAMLILDEMGDSEEFDSKDF